MPLYTFYNKDNGEETQEFMSYTKLDEYLNENPHLNVMPCAPKIISGTGLKPNNNFNDRLKDIKNSHYQSTINTF